VSCQFSSKTPPYLILGDQFDRGRS